MLMNLLTGFFLNFQPSFQFYQASFACRNLFYIVDLMTFFKRFYTKTYSKDVLKMFHQVVYCIVCICHSAFLTWK